MALKARGSLNYGTPCITVYAVTTVKSPTLTADLCCVTAYLVIACVSFVHKQLLCKTSHAHAPKAVITRLKNNIGHYIPLEDREIYLRLKTFGTLWLQLNMPTQSHKTPIALKSQCQKSCKSISIALRKISLVQCLAMSKTKETLFHANICLLS